MKITIAEASKLTGKSVPTLHRHTNNGKLSYSKNKNDEKVVDIVELERAYGKLNHNENGIGENADQVSMIELEKHQNSELLTHLKQDNEYLKSQLKEATTREQQLIDMLQTEQEKSKILMLPKPKPRGSILNYFRFKK